MIVVLIFRIYSEAEIVGRMSSFQEKDVRILHWIMQ